MGSSGSSRDEETMVEAGAGERPAGKEVSVARTPDSDPPAARPPAKAAEPKRLGHYEVIRHLGQGGMGSVYLARDTRLGRRVALKLLLEIDPTRRARFLLEARATARLSHENIVALHDIGEADGTPYLVLEHVSGRTLGAWLKERREAAGERGRVGLPPVRVAELLLPVARALAAAHAAGVVHRDLKPANVMLTDGGAVKVLDFGIAKLLGATEGEEIAAETATLARGDREEGSAHLTKTGLAMGTYSYMSPEQWGGGPIDGRADLWALGVMMFEMVAGKHPLAPLSYTALLDVARLDEPMPSVRDLVPEIGRLGVVIDRCLIKPREDRLASAEELCEELAAIARSRSGPLLGEDEEGNPYSGLAAFQERDAARFFGRETAVEHILARLGDEPLLALVGPSGAGKSSLVRAGVIPALKRSGDVWDAFVLRPGRHPLSEIADLLLRHSLQRSTRGEESAPESLAEPVINAGETGPVVERLREEPGFFGKQLRGRARRRLSRVLVFVDQFEEVFTLAAEGEREAFLACLSGAADDRASPVRVVCAVRQDYLDRVAVSGAAIAERFSRGAVLVGPLDRGGLRRALVEPSAARSYKFESDALLDEMLADLSGATSVLPLLQFTAARLWEGRDRDRRVLTEASYRSFGGVGGALATHADGVLSSLGSAEQRAARALFLRLVTPERTRALITRRELVDSSGASEGELGRVLDRLVEARLVSLGGSADDDSTVELVHESLIASWPVLSRWIDDQAGDAQFRARLRAAAKDWEASGREDGLLWRGDAAEEARRFRDRSGREGADDLGAREASYLAAVIALGEREQRRKRIILGSAVGALAAFAVVVSILSVRSSRAATRAEQQYARAEEQSVRAAAEKLAAEKSAAWARNATRMAVARSARGGVITDPTTALSLLREIEPASTPDGFSPLAGWARWAGVSELVIHQDKLYAASYSPDGARIVATTVDGWMRVFSVEEAKEIFSIKAHDDWVTSASYSPDGSRIVTSSTDKTVKIWKADGTDPITLRGHEKKVVTAAWSPDGTRVATAAADRTVRVWRADGQGEPVVLKGHKDVVFSVGWRSDGQQIISGSGDRTARIFRADGAGEPVVLAGHDDLVVHASWSPGDREILTVSAKVIRVWSPDGKGKPREIKLDNDLVTAAWSPDGERIAATSGGNQVVLVDAHGSGIVPLNGHSELSMSVTFRRDGRRVLSAARDGTLRTWNVERESLPHLLRGHTEPVQFVAWSPDGKRLVSGAGDKTVRLWIPDQVGRSTVLGEHAANVSSVSFDPAGGRVLSSSLDGTMKIFALDGSKAPIVLRGKNDFRAAAWSPDGSKIVAASTDGTVTVWSADGAGDPLTLKGHTAPVLCAAWSPDGKKIVSTSTDKTVRVWSADGAGEPLILTGHDGWVWGAAWSPDGTRIASAAEDKTVRVWRADGAGEPVVLRGHEAMAYLHGDRVWTPDSKRIVSSSNDATVRIWNADGSGKPAVFALPNLSESASFSPDGRRIAVAQGDGAVIVLHDLDPVQSPEDPRLWAETRVCLPLDVRLRVLGFPEDQARADLGRCLASSAEAWSRRSRR